MLPSSKCLILSLEKETQIFENHKYCPGSTALPSSTGSRLLQVLQLYILHLGLWSHFELVFVKGVRSGSRFSPSLACGCPVVLCWKDCSFFCHVIAFAHLSNISWPYLPVSISGLSILFHWSMCLIAGTAISVELLDNPSQQTKAKLSEPQLIRWLDSHKRGWTVSTVLLHYLLSLGPRWYQGHLKRLFRLVWFWMVWKTSSTKSLYWIK